MTPIWRRWVGAAMALMLAWLWSPGIGAAPADAAPPRVTVIGDSVQASFAFTPQAVRLLGRGLDLRMEARSCRRLAAAGCLGGSPPSAVAVAGSLGPALGDVVVVHVGYNDWITAYATDGAMAAFRRAGVRAVVWVLLREASPNYRPINARIREIARRSAARGDQPIVRLADWNSHSAGRGGWFTADRIHLNPTGAMGLAAHLREEVLSVLAELGTSIDGRPVATRIDLHRLPGRAAAIAGDRQVLWFAADGRLFGRNDHNGGALARATRLEVGERPLGDGRGAWLQGGRGRALLTRIDGGVADRRARRSALTPTARPARVAGGGRGGWIEVRCVAGDGVACRDGRMLRRLDAAGRPRGVAAPLRSGAVTALAVHGNALWVATVDRAGRHRIERRDGTTGRVLRTSAVGGPVADLVAGAGGAWVLTRGGALLRVAPGGRTVRRATGLAAVAATGGQLWAVRRDRRTVVRLHPATARVRGRAVAPVRLSGEMEFTDRHLWVLGEGRRSLVRLPRTA